MDTRWYHYVYAFLSGAIFVNFLPHFINGVSGRPFPSPFSNPPGVGVSSPVSNIAWATMNILLAYAFVYFGKLNQRHKTIAIAYFIGGLAMAFYLSNYFGQLNFPR